MLGAIAGDIIGSVYEAHPTKSSEFLLFDPNAHFTDDTVLTVAVADAILNDRDYTSALRDFGRRYPDAGYGASFYKWLQSDDMGPYQSCGNGSAMRVSPVGFAFDTVDEVLDQARASAEVTHDHPEGIKGAQATALAVLMGRQGEGKDAIRRELEARFGYDLSRDLDHVRATYRFEAVCQRSVPESIIAFLQSSDVEDAIRKAISLGGDADTMGCIAGGIAHASYGHVSDTITEGVRKRLPEDLLEVVNRFNQRFGVVS